MNVTFIIFKRPDCTARVFERIRAARPDRLFVIADGARANVPGEAEKVAATRAVCEEIDWPCEVARDYAPENMGCRRRVVSGLNRVFDEVGEAIILEDDILPDPSFFPFCRELLDRYRDDERVGSITGFQFCQRQEGLGASYYFSIYGGIWGWATWRRAWRLYDDEMASWPERRRRRWHHGIFPSWREAEFHEREWDKAYGGADSWGYRWYFTMRCNGLMGIVPATSLTENVGFGGDATRTTEETPGCGVRCGAVEFPLVQPELVEPDRFADGRVVKAALGGKYGQLRSRLGSMKNKHLYGALLRRIPVIGRMWNSYRKQCQARKNTG